MARLLLITTLLFILLPSSALAVRPYRCNGMVQFRPCSSAAQIKLPGQAPKAMPHHLKKPSIKSTAKLLSSSYTALRGQKGQWRGYLAGKGLARLTLDIFQNGKRITSRYMGKVKLTPKDKRVSFAFESPTPKGRNWTWAIRVRTT